MGRGKMCARITEKNKKPGICYACSDDGIELPVIDITHPAFALAVNQAELAAVIEDSVRAMTTRRKIPSWVRYVLFRIIRRHSILTRSIMDSKGTFLSGMGTYLMKLGPLNLGAGYAGRIDRKVAASLPALSARLRLQDMANLIAEGLSPALAASRGRPLHLLNIGGGPAVDSLNALILLRKQRPEWLRDRRICIHILDQDRAGPGFGARALAALRAEGAPLHGLDILPNLVQYDWTDVTRLREVIDGIDAADAVVVGSSEGGLFEYGSDHDIVTNLEALRLGTPSDFAMVGSVMREDSVTKMMMETSRLSIHLRGMDRLRGLVSRAGWVVDRTIEGAACQNFRLKKA
jgi:hypothetical protein